MHLTSHNRFYLNLPALLLTTAIFFSHCKKNDGSPFSFPVDIDLTSKVKSSVSGFVTNENDMAVNMATVQVGTVTVTTDMYGYFEIKDVDVIKNSATVTVTRPGYFKGIKTYIASEGKPAFFRIKLIPKTITGTINGTSGGMVTLFNGLSISIPANAVVTASNNAAYTGTVSIAAHWLNPTASDLPNTMPGDLRGINTNGNLQLLTTYGMAAIELSGGGGELLQIASGKKATLNFPLPSSISSTAPATIPLWYFDEVKGLWKEEGAATRLGNNYVGDVSHFSYWNCDYPGSLVQFDCTIVGANGQPVQNALVKISLVNDPNNWRTGYTNGSGYVNGTIPANNQLKLEVFSDATCTATPLYSQTFTTTAANISLGTIIINNPASLLNVNGTAVNCNNAPVISGLVILKYGYASYAYPLTNGTYNFNLPVCSTPASVSISILDLSTFQLSLPISYILNAGNNSIPNIQACGTTPVEYAYYIIDGTPYYVYSGNAYFSHVLYTSTNPPGQFDNFNVYYDPAMTIPHSGFSVERPLIVPVASAYLQYFTHFNTIIVGVPSPNRITVTYTEYGNVGQYIAGSFAGTMLDNSTGISRNITCSFRVKRRF